MTSSSPVSGLELTPPAVVGPLARLVYHTRMAGYFLVGIGGVGLLAGLASGSLLGFALAAVSVGAGAWLLWTIHHLSLAPEAADWPAEQGPDSLAYGVGLLAVQVVGQVCELAVRLGQAVVKVLACLVAGAGTGLLTTGVFALQQPELWEFQAVQQSGPPLGVLLLGIGVGLLTAEVLLIVLFWRSWSRPARAGAEGSVAAPRQGE